MTDFREIRRKDRKLENEPARQLLREGEYGVLAMCSPEGYGYGIPMNYVLSEHSIYFHCARQGHKIDAVRHNDRVSFCVVGQTEVQPAQFSTRYESVHVFGRIRIVENEEERHRALRLLVEKYSPEHTGISEKYIAGSFQRTEILRLDIEHLSGKSKRK